MIGSSSTILVSSLFLSNGIIYVKGMIFGKNGIVITEVDLHERIILVCLSYLLVLLIKNGVSEMSGDMIRVLVLLCHQY